MSSIGGNQVASQDYDVFSRSGIPFIIAPTGTMANNGAITLGTALPTTYANAYIYLPAGALFTGSAAGWYFCKFSSTTVGQVFNNTYVSGLPSIPQNPTAFLTTGPGAYTGVTTQQTAVSVALPANSLGVNGGGRIEATWSYPNNANNKTIIASFGGFAYLSTTSTTSAAAAMKKSFRNRGVSNSQVYDAGTGALAGGTGAASTGFSSIDCTQTQNFTFAMTLGTATDYLILESYCIEVLA
jgi:hypothetical protein